MVSASKVGQSANNTARKRVLFLIEWGSRILAISIIILLVGFAVWNHFAAKQESARAIQLAAAQSQEETQQKIHKAQDYNTDLINEHQGFVAHPPTDNNWKSDSSYADTLSLDELGLIGSIKIPVIDLDLPIYHGTDNDTLAKGVGHMYGTSLPVGVDNLNQSGQNSVLTSHRGLPNALLFTRLDEVREGDSFTIHTFGQDLIYVVDTVVVIDPNDPKTYESYVTARRGEDRVTLMTCTPFGVNTKRLMVSGYRTHKEIAPQARVRFGVFWWGILALGIAIVLCLVTLIHKKRTKRIAGAHHIRS